MSLTDISLDRTAIEGAICAFSAYEKHTVKQVNATDFNFIISLKGHAQPAMLNVMNLKNGNTTLKTTVGKNQEMSANIADHIAATCALAEIQSKRLYLKQMSEADYTTFQEFVEDDPELEISEPKKIQSGQQYTLTHIQGGTVFINRFDTGAFSVQGKSNHIKGKIVEILTQVLPFKEVITAQLESLDVEITTDQVLSETEAMMPTAFDKLGETLIAIISPCIALRTVNIEMTDYSALAFPILKGVEGVLREVLAHFGINVGENVGGIFVKLPDATYQLPNAHAANIPDPGVLRLINELYNMYHSERHTTFHTRINVGTSRVIEDRAEAVEIIDRGLLKIEELYTRISNANL